MAERREREATSECIISPQSGLVRNGNHHVAEALFFRARITPAKRKELLIKANFIRASAQKSELEIMFFSQRTQHFNFFPLPSSFQAKKHLSRWS